MYFVLSDLLFVTKQSDIIKYIERIHLFTFKQGPLQITVVNKGEGDQLKKEGKNF